MFFSAFTIFIIENSLNFASNVLVEPASYMYQKLVFVKLKKKKIRGGEVIPEIHIVVDIPRSSCEECIVTRVTTSH